MPRTSLAPFLFSICFKIILQEKIALENMSRAGGIAPQNPRPGGPRPGQGPRPEQRGIFLLGNDFNMRYDSTLIIVCVRVCRKVLKGGEG